VWELAEERSVGIAEREEYTGTVVISEERSVVTAGRDVCKYYLK
jgi:hypothetical protein